jgi:hypothetical protein
MEGGGVGGLHQPRLRARPGDQCQVVQVRREEEELEDYTSLAFERNLEVTKILQIKREEEELGNYTSLVLKWDIEVKLKSCVV